MNPNKALWEKGDFSKIAATLRKSAEELVHEIGIKAGDDVLDLACGDGSTAIPSALLGANVTGIDIASNLVAAAKKRASDLGLKNVTFHEGDACNLEGVKDASFDYVVTIFGAMFAPKPLDVAKEMVRVTKPGGTIVMGNWIPNDPTMVAQIFALCSAYNPPKEGFVSPMLWGIEEHVVERFGAAGIPADRITCVRSPYNFYFDGTPEELANNFLHYFGPVMNANEAADANGKGEEFRSKLFALFTSQNKSSDEGKAQATAYYLRVTVKV